MGKLYFRLDRINEDASDASEPIKDSLCRGRSSTAFTISATVGAIAIKRWIGDQLQGRTCTIVLVGAETANRPWVRYEIEQSWNSGKGLLGIRIHKLLDHNQQPSAVGANPFESFTLGDGRKLSALVRIYDPPGATSSEAYNHISDNLSSWIEAAIAAR